MSKTELFTNDQLKIEVRENADSMDIRWMGKSVTRKPAQFITPLLVYVLNKSSDQQKRVILDFRNLDYMNSSTITPIIKILERAKRGATQITVLYEKAKKWQDLSFSALGIFQTKDGRVRIQGMG